MALGDVLREATFQGLTDQQAQDALAVPVDVPRTDGPYSYSGVGLAFAADNIDMSIQLDVPGFIKSLTGGASMDAYLIGAGKLDLSLPGVQAQLAANLAAETVAIRQAAIQSLINRGKPISMPTWQLKGLGSLPAVNDITAARQANADADAVASFVNEQWNPAVASGQTKAQLQALVAAWS